ncbi:MAG: 1,4-alpha-glucan branching protein GlgB [Clostridiales Family XIII bacterium]|jgi:1,4-alpha-glucan branching enzyme|nr:1,4-alpha-glucan branching protein GlgB [Clostridiales Family XIII bacterium]
MRLEATGTLRNYCEQHNETIQLFYEGKAARAYDFFGSRYVAEEKAWFFAVWAPNAKRVSIVGEFNQWNTIAHPMLRYKGIWVLFVPEAKENDLYKYYIDGADGSSAYKTDPCSLFCEKSSGTASRTWSSGGYAWSDSEYLEARRKVDLLHSPVSIYELHIGSWRKEKNEEHPSYVQVAKELVSYVKDMGFTHVEIMPINEYPFDGSWGYQVTGYFAITSRFGTPKDFMCFVDTLHAAGIGVIVDWVPAHFPKDAHGLAKFDGSWLYEHENPLRREHPQWGTYIFNYSRPEVVSFLLSSAHLFFDVYHLDGIRVDAVSSMLYLDYGRDGAFVCNEEGGNIDHDAEEFIRRFNEILLTEYPGTITIAEESTAYPLVTKPPYDGGLGFLFKWNMGFMHDTLDYLKVDPIYRKGHHEKMTFSMHYAFSENFILAYSHDEVVHGKASMIDKMYGSYDEKFASLRTLYAYLFAHPGKKLLFMGDEFAQFVEWNYKKELEWFLLHYDSHAGMQVFLRELNKIYREHGALYEKDNGWDGFEWLNVDDRAHSVFAFRRIGKTESIVCVFNFTPVERNAYFVALPGEGRLTRILNSDQTAYGGKTKVFPRVLVSEKMELNGFSHRVRMKLPPLSAQYWLYFATEKDGTAEEKRNV